MSTDAVANDRSAEYSELHDIAEFNSALLSRYAGLETVTLACIVTANYLFELLIFYASVRRAWTFFPWRIVAFATDEALVARIRQIQLPGLEVRYLAVPLPAEKPWIYHCALRPALVELGELDRAIVTDLDNLFLAETPEIHYMLDRYDFVFISAPHAQQLIQPSFWGFRRTPAAIEFSRRWAQESFGRKRGDASGLPFALAAHADETLKILLLAKAKPADVPHHPCPYDVQTNVRPVVIRRDDFGYVEQHMGRAKVVHFGGLRHKGNTSVAERMRYLALRFAESAPLFPLYLACANEAGERLGLETVRDPEAFLRALPLAQPERPLHESRGGVAGLLKRVLKR